jgi:hypothetical protein
MKKDPELKQLEANVLAAQMNLAVTLKVPELKRAIAVIEGLKVRAAKPAIEALPSRIRELEGLRIADGLAYDWETDPAEHERRQRLLDLRK